MTQPMLPEGPMDAVRRLYEENEAKTSSAMETLVGGHGYSELLAYSTSNIVALIKIGGTVMDSLVRNLHIAGRVDIMRLGHQQARTEDKLELVLQAVEKIEARMASLESGKAVEGSRNGTKARGDQLRSARSQDASS